MAVEGDDASWRALRQELERFFSCRVSDPHHVEDLIQDTFVRVHEHASQLADEDRLAAWVARIARNVWIDELRTRRHAEELTTEPEQASDDDSILTEIQSWLPRMLRSLPERDREALELVELEGLSQARVAERLNLAPSSARSRVQRGRERLRDVLLDCCHIELDRLGTPVDYHRRGDCGGCCQESESQG